MGLLVAEIFLPRRLLGLGETTALCDYYITGFPVLTNRVTIETGTLILVGDGTPLRFDGGVLEAVGRSDARIVIRGETPGVGTWGGISLSDMRPSQIRFVDIAHGGVEISGLETSQGLAGNKLE